jgi:hypothetical protein
MPSSGDRLLQFIIEHEGCGQELEVGHVDHEEEATDIVLRCPRCGASVAIPVTVDEAEAFMQNKGGRFSDADVLRALDSMKKY